MDEKKKNLDPYSVHSRPEEKNSVKNCKKIQKIKKALSGIIFNQNGMRFAEKEEKKFYSRVPFKLDTGKKIPKKIAKQFKKFKNPFPTLFFAKTR